MRRVTPCAITYVVCQVSIFDYPPTIDMPDVVYGRFVLLYPASHHGVLWMVILTTKYFGTISWTFLRLSLALLHNVG